MKRRVKETRLYVRLTNHQKEKCRTLAQEKGLTMTELFIFMLESIKARKA